MTPETLIESYNQNKDISIDVVKAIQSDDLLRENLVEYFKDHRHRDFVIALLNKLMELRRGDDIVVPIEDLMLASYILGLHGEIEDSLKIWEAKSMDFDTYCGFDIQLVPFSGVNETIKYLQSQNSDEAKWASEYLIECNEAGDFSETENYDPWFV